MICPAYGSPDVLQLKEVAKPTPKDNKVLIKVHAAAVGPADCAFRKGQPFIIKLIYGLARPKFAILGVEFAGEIEAAGKDVTLFTNGDQVLGMSPKSFGAHYVAAAKADDRPDSRLEAQHDALEESGFHE